MATVFKSTIMRFMNIKIISISALGLLSIFLNTAKAQQKGQDYVCTDGYTSNLRSNPSLSSNIVAKLSKYTPLLELERQGPWVEVKTKNFQGWVHQKLLDKSIECVQSTKSYKTHKNYTSGMPHKYRGNVLTGEGFKVLKTEVGMTQVKDKSGHVFWLENHILWPKSKLESLHL